MLRVTRKPIQLVAKEEEIVSIYERKGDSQDCQNYTGISLHSIPGKVFTNMIQNRMH